MLRRMRPSTVLTDMTERRQPPSAKHSSIQAFVQRSGCRALCWAAVSIVFIFAGHVAAWGLLGVVAAAVYGVGFRSWESKAAIQRSSGSEAKC